jgi:lipid II:glycine glycyltransferase (peptidoglycan interpeptide bridge formation enzyme)
MQEELQPRWIFVTDVYGKTLDDLMKDMDAKTRQILRKNERDKIKCREIGYDELDKFKDIMQHTGDRRNFIDRPLKYYQDMYNYLGKDGILKILVAELDLDELIGEIDKEISDLETEYKDKETKYNRDPSKMNKDKYEKSQKQIQDNIERLNKKKNHEIELKNEHGSVLTLGGILFLIYGDEVLSLVGGSYDKYMEFQSAYTVHFEGMKMALNGGYKRYNFYGITGVFDENNPLFGLYSFKRDFGGKVVELMGEFDLVTNKFYYVLYKVAFKTYHFLKSIKFKLTKGGK